MIKRKAKINVYKHSIDLSRLEIKNQIREKFREDLEKIDYKGYEVENISDGRKIVITKPGGKFSFGTIKRDDFMVWVYSLQEGNLGLFPIRTYLMTWKKKVTQIPRKPFVL